MDTDVFPRYLHIALDLAEKIAAGNLEEKQKLSGRSPLDSGHGASPEAVQRFLQSQKNPLEGATNN